MKAELPLMIAVLMFSLIGSAAGATITFDKSLDVPDRNFTVTYEGNTFSFTIADIGNYKIGENVGVTVSGGVNNMRLVLFTVDKLTPWSSTFFDTGGSVSATIPANKFNISCPDVCDDGSGGYKMGPGIYALAVQNRDNSDYFIAKPIIISKYNLTVTPSSTLANAGNTIKVTVNISMNGVPVNVAPNNVKVEFLQDSNGTHFGNNAIATTTPGTYETNIEIPSSASGIFRLYAAITTSRNIYQDYPEIIGASSYNGTITITSGASTPTPTPTPVPGAPSISIVPSSTTGLNHNNTFSVDVAVNQTGLTVGGVEINLKFDPIVVQLNSVVIGSFLGSDPQQFQNMTDNTNGMLKLSHTVNPGNPAVTSPGIYATLNFKVKSNAPAGTSTLNLTMAKLANATGANIPGVTRNNGTLTVNPPTLCILPNGKDLDLNHDGSVGIGDAVVLTNNWDALGGPADLNNDGVVGIGDAVVLINHWDQVC